MNPPTMKRLVTTILLLLWGLCAFAVQRSSTIVYINGAKYYVHTVQPGETLYSLAKAYAVSEQAIVRDNPSAAAGLKAGENLRIPYAAEKVEQLSGRKMRKTFDTHRIAEGETLYAISRRYEIPIRTIVEDNPSLDPIRLRPGSKLLIRKKQRGSEDEAGSREAWEEYRNSLNSVAEAGYAYHLVAPGETVYALSRRFGISEEELSALNDGLKPADLKAGAILKVPAADTTALQSTTPPVDTASACRPTVEEIEFRPLAAHESLDVALLLPLEVNGVPNANYLEFYQGFLLGLDSVRLRHGISTHVTLFNTARNPERIEELTTTEAFRRARLIVGPVYEEGLHPVVRHAEREGIPVVSPLAHLTKISSDALFQLAPDPEYKYAKVAELLDGSRRITLIYTERTDREFESEILKQLEGRTYQRHTYRYVHPSAVRSGHNPSDLTPLLENGDDNVFIVMSDNEVDVDRILAALASADTSLTSRGRTAPRFTVLGNARWNRYNNIDRTMFFKNSVVFVSTYHAKRDASVVADFDSAYIRAFGSLPTLYSYRGYDAAMIFVPGMYNDIQYDMEGRTFAPLQTTYLFGRREDAPGTHVNRNWTRVNYNKNFTITIE